MKYITIIHDATELHINVDKITYIYKMGSNKTHICIDDTTWWNIDESIESILNKIREANSCSLPSTAYKGISNFRNEDC